MPHPAPDRPPIGPLMFVQRASDSGLTVAVIMAQPENAPPPQISGPAGAAPVACVAQSDGTRIWRATLDLPQAATAYTVNGTAYPVQADVTGDLRIAYVSCNGQEADDLGRDPAHRNHLWQRLQTQHRESPFQILLHGGDQIYADEVLDTHPLLRAWRRRKPMGRARLDTDRQAEIQAVLDRAFLDRYCATLGQPETAWLMARVPSLAMWDDHDICDGWGSLDPGTLDCAMGRLIFATARRWFLIFQTGTAPDGVPVAALDPGGETLTLHIALPGVDLIAPDLRSERRPERVLGPKGWAALETAMARARTPRTLLLSSVPGLGPRLSLLERAMHYIPRAQKYEDDLRDQWQSRWHRDEWRRFLRLIADHHAAGRATTLISGEIHLATRATMQASPAPIHQLVASGIAHDAPPALWARTLGALAHLGEAPLPDHPIRLDPLPGQRSIYIAERNYLVLTRRGTAWDAVWHLEHSGATPPLQL